MKGHLLPRAGEIPSACSLQPACSPAHYFISQGKPVLILKTMFSQTAHIQGDKLFPHMCLSEENCVNKPGPFQLVRNVCLLPIFSRRLPTPPRRNTLIAKSKLKKSHGRNFTYTFTFRSFQIVTYVV